jgi:hypothetical protein
MMFSIVITIRRGLVPAHVVDLPNGLATHAHIHVQNPVANPPDNLLTTSYHIIEKPVYQHMLLIFQMALPTMRAFTCKIQWQVINMLILRTGYIVMNITIVILLS